MQVFSSNRRGQGHARHFDRSSYQSVVSLSLWLTVPQKQARQSARLSFFVSDRRRVLRTLRAGRGGLEMIVWETGVAVCGHCGSIGERPFETQLAENGRTTAVLLPGGLLVNIRPRVMGRGN
jgi:hypothetical protein